MVNGLNNSRRWTPAQGYMIGSSLVNLIRQGWQVAKANQLPSEGGPLYWEVALTRNGEALNVVVSDSPVMRGAVTGPLTQQSDAA